MSRHYVQSRIDNLEAENLGTNAEGRECWTIISNESDGWKTVAAVELATTRRVIPASESLTGKRRLISTTCARVTVRVGFIHEVTLGGELEYGMTGPIGALREIMAWIGRGSHMAAAVLDLSRAALAAGIDEREIARAGLGWMTPPEERGTLAARARDLAAMIARVKREVAA